MAAGSDDGFRAGRGLSGFSKVNRILITGASGFIGRQVALALGRTSGGSGDQIHTVQHTARQMSDSRNHTVDLMDPKQVDRLMERLQPTHLIHLAWYAEHGKFWVSPRNLDWVAASVHLFQTFVNNGGQRALFAGSSAEYDWSSPSRFLSYTQGPDRSRENPGLLLNEEKSPSHPSTLYGVCKNSLRQMIEKFSPIPTAWARIFFLYGPGEDARRLVPSILHPLLDDQPAIVRSGAHVRNLMHVEDSARALVHILKSPATGIINVASPETTTLENVARILGDLTGKSPLLQIEYAPGTADNPLVLTADTAKLSNLGFVSKYSLASGLAMLVP
jgi:nucleoside-diphosphate-sugar epimerase